MVNWVMTYSGVDFDLSNPTPDQVNLTDIIKPIASQVRFNGHAGGMATVGIHSLMCSYLMPVGMEVYGLIHDFHEAYIGDIPKPIKDLIGRESDVLKDLESSIDQAIYNKFDIDPPTTIQKEMVKKADAMCLKFERESFLDYREDVNRPWGDWFEQLDVSRIEDDEHLWKLYITPPASIVKLLKQRCTELGVTDG